MSERDYDFGYSGIFLGLSLRQAPEGTYEITCGDKTVNAPRDEVRDIIIDEGWLALRGSIKGPILEGTD